MIWGIIGYQGSGKTLLLVKMALDYVAQGKKIYSNVHLKNIDYEIINYNDIINCVYENAVIIIDEIHLLLPARLSTRRINREICDSFLSMVRKKNLIVLGTTQTLRKVDIRFREEMDFLIRVKKYAYYNNSWNEAFHSEKYDKKIPIMIQYNVLDTNRLLELDCNFIANYYYNEYNTNQIIKIDGIT